MVRSVLVFFVGIVVMLNGISCQNQIEMEEKRVVHYLALGDSYTIGEGVLSAERFPIQTLEKLKNVDLVNSKVDIIATTGWTTRDLLDAMDREELNPGAFDIISLLIGVNNQYQAKPIEQYRSELRELIERALGLLNGDNSKLVLVSIPDYGVTPFASSRDIKKIAEEIEMYNSVKESYAREYGVRYVYITDLTEKAGEDETLLASDGLHPSGKLYEQWATRLAPVIEKMLTP